MLNKPGLRIRIMISGSSKVSYDQYLLDPDPDPDPGIKISPNFEKMCAKTSSKIIYFTLLIFLPGEDHYLVRSSK